MSTESLFPQPLPLRFVNTTEDEQSRSKGDDDSPAAAVVSCEANFSSMDGKTPKSMPIKRSADITAIPIVATTEHLQQLNALSGIDRDVLFCYGTIQRFEANEEVISRGQIIDSVYWVLSGILIAHCCSSETRVLLGRWVAGDTIGEISVMDPGRTTLTVAAVEAGRLFTIRRDDLDRYIEDHPASGIDVLKYIATQLARRLRCAKEQLVRESEGRFGFGEDY